MVTTSLREWVRALALWAGRNVGPKTPEDLVSQLRQEMYALDRAVAAFPAEHHPLGASLARCVLTLFRIINACDMDLEQILAREFKGWRDALPCAPQTTAPEEDAPTATHGRQVYGLDLSYYETAVRVLVQAAVDVEDDALWAQHTAKLPQMLSPSVRQLSEALRPYRNDTWPQSRRVRDTPADAEAGEV